MADYTSTHTGAEIDAGVSQAQIAVVNAPLETGENSLIKAVYMTKTAYTALPSKVATTLYIVNGA